MISFRKYATVTFIALLLTPGRLGHKAAVCANFPTFMLRLFRQKLIFKKWFRHFSVFGKDENNSQSKIMIYV